MVLSRCKNIKTQIYKLFNNSIDVMPVTNFSFKFNWRSWLRTSKSCSHYCYADVLHRVCLLVRRRQETRNNPWRRKKPAERVKFNPSLQLNSLHTACYSRQTLSHRISAYIHFYLDSRHFFTRIGTHDNFSNIVHIRVTTNLTVTPANTEAAVS